MKEKKDLSALRISREQKRGGKTARSGLWIALFLFALAVIILAGFRFYYRADAVPESDQVTDAKPSPPAPAAATSSGGREVLIASGYVVAHHRISLGSKVTGKVSWIGVEKGDRVRKGQLLVKLDDKEFRAQLEQAQGEMAAARARLAELEAGSRPQEIERARADLDESKAELSNAVLQLQRLQTLLKSGVVSQEEVDAATTRYRVAEASVKAAMQSYDLLKIGPRQEELDRARADLERARASVAYRQALLEATEIRAPIDGTILQRIAELGEMVTTSFAGEQGAKSSVVAMADLNDLQVELDISQSDFQRISSELGCVMSPEAYPDRKYSCRIAEISPEANRQKATIQVKVQILKPDSYLRPDMDARVTFFRPQTNDSAATAPDQSSERLKESQK